MTDTPQVLLAHHLKALKLPNVPARILTSWPASAPPRASTIAATCDGSPNWS